MTTIYQSMVEFLVSEYDAAITQHNKSVASGLDAEVIDLTHHVTILSDFRTFCEEYLNKYRPSQLTHGDGNYIIQLDNSKQFLVGPELKINTGGMQPTHAIPVTGKETRRESARTEPPAGLQDLTLPQPAKRHDR